MYVHRFLAIVALIAGCGGDLSSDGQPLLSAGPVWDTQSVSQQILWPTGADINGDGYSDLIVGNPFYDGGPGNNAGIVRVWFGSPDGVDTAQAPDQTFLGPTAGALFGFQVDVAGDVNGDGYIDIAVVRSHGNWGLPRAEQQLADGCSNAWGTAGVMLLTGGASGLSVDPWLWEPGLGACVSWAGGAGDMNGDGFDDLVVGAPESGGVNLFLGDEFGLATLPITFNPEARTGRHVTAAGDVNGDGWDDLLVLAHDISFADSQAWIVGGSPTTPVSGGADWTSGFRTSDWMVWGTGGADWNRDGFADIAIADRKAYDLGETAFFLGSDNWLNAVSTPFWWTADGDFAVRSPGPVPGQMMEFVQVLGDLNGDAFPDVSIGETWWDEAPGTDTGRGQIFLGNGSGIESSPSFTEYGSDNAAQGGQGVLHFPVGDLNGDGLMDIAGLVPNHFYGEYIGQIRVHYGELSAMESTASHNTLGNGPGSGRGPVFNLGDINDDGFEDLAQGEPGFENTAANQGAAQIYLGLENGLEASAIGPGGTEEGEEFGFAIAGQADVDRDGIGDYAVGAPGFDDGGDDRGQVTVYFGGPGLPDAAADWTFTSDTDGDRAGEALAMGDFDRNGYGDLVVGAPGFNGGEGRVYLFLAQSTGLPSEPDQVIVGGESGCSFGKALAAGDFDGDGVDDFAVGGPGCQAGEGEARVYALGVGGTEGALAWTFDGTGESGWSLASAGDLNDDGAVELLVGSPLDSAVATAAGRASAVSQGVEAASLVGANPGDQVGRSVASGDVDFDGTPDWFVGAPGFTSSLNNQGAVFVVEAPTVGSNAADRTLLGETAAEALGSHVATGDWNRDGAADLAAGGEDYTEVASVRGVVRVHFGLAEEAGVPIGPRYVEIVDPLTDAPVAPGSSPTGAEVQVHAVDVPIGGSTRARLIIELKEHTEPFDGQGLVYGEWTHTGFRGYDLYETLDTLTEQTAYKVRARIQYARKYAAAHPQTPWLGAGSPGRDGGLHFATPCFEDLDGDGSPGCNDCDDTDAANFPGNPEVCDGEDNDCDGSAGIDEVDVDTDGVRVCDGDCDDDEGDVNPLELESTCDGLDNDCDPGTPDDPNVDGDAVTFCDGDCDDDAAAIYPGAGETTCDGIDNDCDAATEDTPDGDGDSSSVCDDCDDGDATRSPLLSEVECDGIDNDCDELTEDAPDGDGDGSSVCDDCDDTDSSLFPGAPESCDGVQTNCDVPLGGDEVDGDGDSYFACNDCDDTDAAINPGATELCNGIDDDCEPSTSATDEVDDDGDGQLLCGDDCDDDDPAVYTGAPEACDGVDQDCDGAPDADEVDLDGDGYLACAECDDSTVEASPDNTTEHCDGIDNTCDGDLSDEQDGDGDGFVACDPWLGVGDLRGGDCLPEDPDGYPGAPEAGDAASDLNCDGTFGQGDDVDDDGVTVADGDCDDTDEARFPGNEEVCDGVDNDCDEVLLVGELVDIDGDGARACEDCNDVDSSTGPGFAEVCDGADNDCNGSLEPNEADVDGDGFPACEGRDCDDGDPAIHRAATEIAGNGIDENCDGSDGCEDEDGDGIDTCSGDCDDSDPDVGPFVGEVCNFIDDDCDGEVDEDYDEDEDGWTICEGDCADTPAQAGGVDPATIHPRAPANCDDGVDNDCDPDTSESLDHDGDGFVACPPTGEAGDCWEGNDLVHPEAEELCDHIDNNCDAAIDEGWDEDGDGYKECTGECNDLDFNIHPGAEEVCGDGIANDCHGEDEPCDEPPTPTPTPPSADDYVLPHGCVCDSSARPAVGWALLLIPALWRRRWAR